MPKLPDGWWGSSPHLERTPVVDEAVRRLRPRFRRAAARDIVAAHGDSHPGDLLWSRGRVSA